MKKVLLMMALVVGVFTATAQTSVTGKVVDKNTGEGLPGATVQVEGTTNGTITDLDGNFSISTISADKIITISFVGYETQKIELNGKTNLGTIKLSENVSELTPLEVIASVAVDRKTPVAVSSIKQEFIIEKASNQEFPELLKTTPGVYATKQGGGYGDSRINLRGFSSVNVAVMINGIPVNDMESGKVYWSNWAGLTDVTRSMQVQRGLGASKVAVPSIGGTINILTKTTDAVKGGSIFAGIGNDGYQKQAVSFSTGLTDNKWAVSVQLARIKGNGWVDGTEFEGYNYFLNVSKMLGNHTLSFTGFGAPQRHGQRQNRQTIETFRETGLKYNSDWGIYQGKVLHVEDNFYHKPQFSLNHFWTINDKSELSTAAYFSIGTGGGGGTAVTKDQDGTEVSFNDYRLGGKYGPYDLDAIAEKNKKSSDGRALAYLRASRNDHQWYGILTTYTNQISDNFNLLAGVDARYYKGIHFSEVTNLLGGKFAIDKRDKNKPVRALKVGDKRDYYNDGIVNWLGGFLQGEYSISNLSVFVSLALSNTGYQRVDYYNYLKGNQKSKTVSYLGYQAKGGLNYNITENHNIFANAGYLSKAPDFKATFRNYKNDINPNAVNQTILSFELGYGYRSAKLNGNINLYSTTWRDRTFTQNFTDKKTRELFVANIQGVDARHNGVEVDFSYKPIEAVSLRGMVSVGDWKWINNVDSVSISNEQNVVVGTTNKLYLKGLKVGDAAQTTASFGADFKITKGLKIGATYNYYDNLYASFKPTERTNDKVPQAWKVPSYHLLDGNLSYRFKLGNISTTFYGNVQNIFDVAYISDANDGDNDKDGISDAAGAAVFYGMGRTWTAGLKFRF